MMSEEQKAENDLILHLSKAIKNCDKLADLADEELDAKKVKYWEITKSLLIKLKANV